MAEGLPRGKITAYVAQVYSLVRAGVSMGCTYCVCVCARACTCMGHISDSEPEWGGQLLLIMCLNLPSKEIFFTKKGSVVVLEKM